MRAAKVDENQHEIVSFFRKIGCSVALMHAVGEGFPDLVVGKQGVNLLVEVRDGRKCQSAQQLTTAQKIWHDGWQGQKAVVNSIDAAIALSRQYGWA